MADQMVGKLDHLMVVSRAEMKDDLRVAMKVFQTVVWSGSMTVEMMADRSVE
jgi:hypothetical protein